MYFYVRNSNALDQLRCLSIGGGYRILCHVMCHRLEIGYHSLQSYMHSHYPLLDEGSKSVHVVPRETIVHILINWLYFKINNVILDL